MVEWAMPSTLDEFFQKVTNYARGDVKAWYSPHIRKIASMWARYLIFVAVPPLFVVYLVWATGRNYDYVRSKWALVYIPILRVATDIAIMWGSLTAR
jgi:ferric iron reductase protein FhuF